MSQENGLFIKTKHQQGCLRCLCATPLRALANKSAAVGEASRGRRLRGSLAVLKMKGLLPRTRLQRRDGVEHLPLHSEYARELRLQRIETLRAIFEGSHWQLLPLVLRTSLLVLWLHGCAV